MNNQTCKISKSAAGLSLSICMFIGTFLFTLPAAQAQVNVNVNISSQSLWGPSGYDYVEYYYIPEADAFYYVPTGQFIYWSGGNYLFANSLPMSYHINLYSTYMVVVNKPKPYLQHNIYVTKYGKYKKAGRNYIPIRDSNEEKYYVVKGHPKHGSGGSNGSGKKMAPANNKTSGNTKSSVNKAPKASQKSSPQQNHKQKSSSNGKGSKGH